jgi:hypothetical protein
LNTKPSEFEVHTAVNEEAVDIVFFRASGPALRLTRPPFDEYQVSFPQVKRQGREVNHSPLCRAEVTNEWSYTLLAHLPIWRGKGKLYLTAMNNNP